VGTLSCEIVKTVQSDIGVESCLHLVAHLILDPVLTDVDLSRYVAGENR
jgi:hypothetical protein